MSILEKLISSSDTLQKGNRFWIKDSNKIKDNLIYFPVCINQDLQESRKKYSTKIDDAIYDKISNMCNNKHSEFFFLLTMFSLFLHKLCNTNSPCFFLKLQDTFIHKNGLKFNHENVVYSNTEIDIHLSLRDLFIKNQPRFVEMLQHYDFPVFSALTDEYDKTELTDMMAKSILLCQGNHDTADFKNFGICFNLNLDAGIQLDVHYNANMFTEFQIIKAVDYYSEVLKSIDGMQTVISDIPLLPATDRAYLLHEYNSDDHDSASLKSVPAMIMDQISRTPDHTAISYRNIQTGYKDLMEMITAIEAALLEKELEPQARIGIFLDHTPETIAAMIAVLKRGLVMVPLNIHDPINRITYILEDSGIHVLLTRNEIAGALDMPGIDKVYIEDITPGADAVPPVAPDMSNLAYILYTSGSTGRPKGVKITHEGFSNYITWASNRYSDTTTDNYAVYSPFSFDFTLTSVFCPLVKGGGIYLYNNETNVIKKILDDDCVNVLKITPAHLDLMEPVLEHTALKRLIIGGEILTTKKVAKLQEKVHKAVEILNEYGPTEAVVGCMEYAYQQSDDQYLSVPIGGPIKNMKIYLLTDSLTLTPLGQEGEIYIGGIGVAEGYQNKEALTAKSFLPDPFSDIPGAMMYKTGDRAIIIDHGKMIFLGRKDNQISIRGYRIELSEIKKIIQQIPDVKDAVVHVIGEEDNRYTAAFLIADTHLDCTGIESYLKTLLPHYMVPHIIKQVESYPLTKNGKIDYHALEALLKVASTNELPKTPQQIKIGQIIARTLKTTKKIGLDLDFIQLGGNSLKAIHLIDRITAEFGINIPITDFYETPTIRGIDTYLNSIKAVKHSQDDMTILKKGADDKNIYFIHSATGDVHEYFNICKQITTDATIVGRRYTDTHVWPVNISIKTLAEKYAKNIIKRQNGKPVVLIGWSFGGVVSYEIIKILEGHGYQNNLLILIDSYATPTTSEKKLFTMETEQAFLKNFAYPITPACNYELYWKNMLSACESHKIHKSDVIACLPGMQASWFKDITSVPDLITRINMLRSFDQALHNYHPDTPIRSKIIYVKAKQNPHDASTWEKVNPNNVTHYTINTTHMNIIDAESAPALAGIITKHLIQFEKGENQHENI